MDDGRQKWERPIEFLFSCIAMCVGLGNVWRFPFTAFKNGGGMTRLDLFAPNFTKFPVTFTKFWLHLMDFLQEHS